MVRILREFPHAVREIPHLRIRLSDGVRLAARLWLPEGAEQRPVPAILEYVPYRLHDGTIERDALTHPWLAGHGFACLRVDLRGSGESEGLLLDEYLPQEQSDAVELVSWIAAQPWCSGRVGMLGISWGGFAGLQLAALRPPALRAVATLCSTDDRYADDVHFKGGCLLNENTSWGATMLAYQSRPPDPAVAGPAWRELWQQRLEAMPFWPALWLAHPTRDDYWRHGSVREDYGAIEAAVFAVGGWGDAYSNAVPRLLQGLRAPVKGLIGPWIHKYPHFAPPEPRIGFLQELARFFGHYLADRPTGFAEVPPLRAYVFDSVPPAAIYARRPGRWRSFDGWPPPQARMVRYGLTAHGLRVGRGDGSIFHLRTPETLGAAGGRFCAMWAGPEWPTDQRPDDALSLCFDTPPFPRPVEILGAPVLEVELRSDAPHAHLIARLCDVAPDGASTRMSWGCLDLTHRHGHDRPEPLEEGRACRVRLQLDDLAWRLAAGHRLRLALSTTYWPMLWPSPWRARLEIVAAHSALVLPLAEPADAADPSFDPPEAAPPARLDELRRPQRVRRVGIDAASGRTTTELVGDFGRQRLAAHDLVRDERVRERYTVLPGDPLSARTRIRWRTERARGDWRVRTEVTVEMRADRNGLHLRGGLGTSEDRGPVRWRTFVASVPHLFSATRRRAKTRSAGGAGPGRQTQGDGS